MRLTRWSNASVSIVEEFIPLSSSSDMKPIKSSKSSIELVILALCCGLAFFLTYLSGGRGFFAFDQSIVFDGGYRIFSGQIPYKDFVFPFGPVTFYLQAIFFKVLGISFRSYLICAATIACVAAGIAMVIVRFILGRNLLAELIAGIFTAVWFYAPFGTPWVDQTAFFFALIAILALVTSTLAKSSRLKVLLVLGCGVAWLASFLSKQNVGAFIGPLFPIAFFVGEIHQPHRAFRAIGFFVLGIVAGSACFLGWLFLCSDPGAFVNHFFHLPSRLGSQRLASLLDTGFGFLKPYFDGRGPWIVNLMMVISVIIGIGGLQRSSRIASGLRLGSIRLGSLLCIYLPCFQHIFINTTLNQADNGFAFAGVSFALATGIGTRLLKSHPEQSTCSSKRIQTVIQLMAILMLVLASMSGIRVSLERRVHDIFEKPAFANPIEIENLKPLHWAHPTAMGTYEISEASIVNLYEYLKRSNCNFFIFPDFTIFYGLLGVPSPQPLLWFHRGVTYDRDNNSQLDSAIVASLEANRVQLLVLEQVSWFNTGERLNDFPKTKAYLMANFAKSGQIGTFLIYRKHR